MLLPYRCPLAECHQGVLPTALVWGPGLRQEAGASLEYTLLTAGRVGVLLSGINSFLVAW